MAGQSPLNCYCVFAFGSFLCSYEEQCLPQGKCFCIATNSLLVSGWAIQGVLLGVALFCSGDIYWTAWCSLTLCFWGLHYSFVNVRLHHSRWKNHWLQVWELCDTVNLFVSHLNSSPVPHLLYTSLLVTIIVFGIYADRQAKIMTSYLDVLVKSLLSAFSAGGEECIIHEP